MPTGMLRSAWVLVSLSLMSASCASGVDASMLEKQHSQILEMRAPRYTGTGGKKEALHFVRTEFIDWVRRRKKATDELLGNYQIAISETKDESELAELYADVAELEFDFAREFAEGGVAAVGESQADDVGAALTSAASARFDAATRAADVCVEKAQRDSTQARERCSKIKVDVAELRGRWKGHPIPGGFPADRVDRRDYE